MRILLAEDERMTRRSLERELTKWGHEVVAVEDGLAAWEVYEGGRFDLVLTDWEMPRLDGRELIRRIRAEPSASGYAYLIMLTARSGTGDVVSGIEAGADDFVAKPFDRDELRVRLKAGQRIIELERSLEDRNRSLRDANERIHKDLRAAARVQQDLLPRHLPETERFCFSWKYRPCDELGGDLLNVVRINDRQIAMYLADVSGHGVAASLVSVSVHRSLSVRRDRSSLILDEERSGSEAVAGSIGCAVNVSSRENSPPVRTCAGESRL